ncbi:MAG: T9SS type A sorting domain-containing protein, partial [Candidatus Neomarinimicrobiota bacterium]|nr:T9SS type A sorting domain-containing protein [Candidatus Neomarinimicrobiota bacterium]
GDGYEEELVASSVALNDEVVEYTIYLEGEGPKLSLDDPSTMPMTFALHQNFPNPFNPSTTIHYVLAEEVHVILTVYDLLGKQVKRVVNETQNAGIKTIVWDGTDLWGADVSTGLYLYNIRAGTFSQTRKMVLIR